MAFWSFATKNQAINTAPLFFVRSGYVGNWLNGNIWIDDYNKLNYPGVNAYYWSRSSSDSANAFNLIFYDTNVRLSGIDYRYFGFSLRCLYPHVK